MLQIKSRLEKIGKNQVWLLFQLRDKGINIQPPTLSQIIRGIYTYPKARSILNTCDEILKEVESKNANLNSI